MSWNFIKGEVVQLKNILNANELFTQKWLILCHLSVTVRFNVNLSQITIT